jgi:ribosome-associated heat shock protein Hsp15
VTGLPAQRIDKWLWYARFFRAREQAAAYIEDGRMRLAHPGGPAQRVAKPSQLLRPGDILTFALGPTVHVVRVEAAGQRRGPPADARRLYTDLSEKDHVSNVI